MIDSASPQRKSGQATRTRRFIIALVALAFSAYAERNGLIAPLGLPALCVPEDNPLTRAKIELGRKLFMDRRLSSNHTMSCAMCHVPEQGFAVNEMKTAIGFEGKSARRNAPTLLNVAYAGHLLRDGKEPSLESQVWGPLLARNEMANPSAHDVIAKIRSLADYSGLFEAAFEGEGPSKDTIGRALASYERTLVSGNSSFDRWLFGNDSQVLTPEEQRGFSVFNQSGCPRCHVYDDKAALFSDDRFHNIGSGARQGDQHSVQLAPGVFIEIADEQLASISEPAQRDQGRFEVTGNPIERNAFRTPSLRNVALTAPYMHDGSLATLEAVIEFYQQTGIGDASEDSRVALLSLTAEDKRALIAFLRTLTGDNVEQLAREARAAFKDYAVESH